MVRKFPAVLIGLMLSNHLCAQTAPEKPHLIMWPQAINVSGSIAPNPSSAIPIVRDDRNTGENRGAVYTAEQAAQFASHALVADFANGWIDGTNLALLLRYIGADVFVQDAAAPFPFPQNPDSDPRRVWHRSHWRLNSCHRSPVPTAVGASGGCGTEIASCATDVAAAASVPRTPRALGKEVAKATSLARGEHSAMPRQPACVSGDCSGLAAHADPDFNHDGNLDQDDVTALINTIAGGGCPE